MAIVEKALRILIPEKRTFLTSRAEKKAKLSKLANEAVPAFRELLDFHAKELVDDYNPNRLRDLLENHQATIAVVDQRRPRMLRAFASDHHFDTRVSLVVVINGGKLIHSFPEQRNEAMAQLLVDYRQIKEDMVRNPAAVFTSVPVNSSWWDVPSMRVLESNGFKREDVEFRLYRDVNYLVSPS